MPGEPAAALAMPFRGGRLAADERLAGFDPLGYARTRNHVDGGVSGLSPWIRHGVLPLATARDAALAKAGGGAEIAADSIDHLFRYIEMLFEVGTEQVKHRTVGDSE